MIKISDLDKGIMSALFPFHIVDYLFYIFKCTLTVWTDSPKIRLEYRSVVSPCLLSILPLFTSPQSFPISAPSDSLSSLSAYCHLTHRCSSPPVPPLQSLCRSTPTPLSLYPSLIANSSLLADFGLDSNISDEMKLPRVFSSFKNTSFDFVYKKLLDFDDLSHVA